MEEKFESVKGGPTTTAIYLLLSEGANCSKPTKDIHNEQTVIPGLFSKKKILLKHTNGAQETHKQHHKTLREVMLRVRIPACTKGIRRRGDFHVVSGTSE